MDSSTKTFLAELAAHSKACDKWTKATQREAVANPEIISKLRKAHPEVFAAQTNPRAAIRDVAKFYA